MTHTEERKRRLAIFAHYDVDNVIDDYVVYYLAALSRADCDVVFVSTSNLPSAETARVSLFCRDCICRDNTGYDFLSYKEGLYSSSVNVREYETVVLCNDSVYGPLYDLSSVFSKMEGTNADFWGVTDSRELRPHVQTYFVAFGKKLVNSGALDDFFGNVTVLKEKQEIIERYEIGLTSFLLERGFSYRPFMCKARVLERMGVFCKTAVRACPPLPASMNRSSAGSLAKRALSTARHFKSVVLKDEVNYTFFFWDYGIARRNPFVKVALLRPLFRCIPSEQHVLRMITLHSAYPCSLIAKHLERTRRKYVCATNR